MAKTRDTQTLTGYKEKESIVVENYHKDMSYIGSLHVYHSKVVIRTKMAYIECIAFASFCICLEKCILVKY